MNRRPPAPKVIRRRSPVSDEAGLSLISWEKLGADPFRGFARIRLDSARYWQELAASEPIRGILSGMGEGRITSRGTWAILGSSVAVAVILLAGGSADGSNSPSFRGFATCSAYGVDPDRTCSVGSAFLGAFISKKADRVRYTLCVTNKGSGAKSCFKKKTRKAGKPSMISLWRKNISEDPGRYRLKWRVKGRGIVARANLRVVMSI